MFFSYIKKVYTMKRLSKKNILLIIGIVLVFSITLGSAIVSSLLQISGKTTIKENSWVIYFDSVRKSTDSVNATSDATITNFEKTRIDFSVDLTEPGEFYEFTVYTVNDGSIDAMVDSVEKSLLTDAQKKYLDFFVTYDNGREIKRCDPLDAHTRKRIKAIVKFKEGVDVSDYPQENTNLNLYFDINYVQKDDACPPDPVGNEKILTIRPHGGIYNGRSDETRIYIEPGKTYEIQDVTRFLYNFVRWDVIIPEENGTYTLEDNLFTMGDEDVTIEAVWEEGAYVARIMNKYYTSIQEAFDHVDDGWDDNTVYLLKNQNEDPINNAANPFVFNLGGYTVTGQLINNKDSSIGLVNGKIQAEAEQSEAVRNYGSVTLGTQGGGVQIENSIAIVGNEIGLHNINKNGNYGNFYFYDGYIEAVAALVGGYTGLEEGYYIFSEHIPERNDQRVYLVKNPNRAVAKTTTDGVIYYYNLQDAINQASINKKAGDLPDTDYVISAVRNFEAAYKLKVESDETIIFDLDGHTITTGDTVTNNGSFTIKNTSQTASTIKPSRTITNTNALNISNVSIKSTTDANTIDNSGALTLTKTTIQANDANGIYNRGTGTVQMDSNTFVDSTTTYGLYNAGSNLVLNNGVVDGIYNSGTITLTGTLDPNTSGATVCLYNTGTATLDNFDVTENIGKELFYSNGGTITVNGGKLTNNNEEVIGLYYADVIINDGAELKSKNYSTISGTGTTTINNGYVECENSTGVSTTTLVMNNGEVSGKEYGASVSSLTLNNGTISSEGVGAWASSATINGGTITGVSYGLDSNDVVLKNGTVSATDGIGINSQSCTMSNGTVNGVTYGIKTNNLTMSDGEVNSLYGVGILLNSNGTITGGTVTGDTYGVYAKNKATIGSNDGNIISTSPVIVGDLYGLYIEGNDINFYDGILKGQTDGYYGKITGLPTGGLVVDGEETIDEVLYQTDTVSAFRNWLQVGDEQFNNIESACDAITESGTITVIDDVDIRFIQNFTNGESSKDITFDLNGHSITTTQPIYNHSNVTIVDSSDLKTGNITANRVAGVINDIDGNLTINAGTYNSTTTTAVIENRNIMEIGGGHVSGIDTGILNYSKLTINDILIDNTPIGIRNNSSTSISPSCGIRGQLVFNGGTINASDIAINKEGGSTTINGGVVYGVNYGIGGSDGYALVNDGLVKATTHNALYTYYGETRVTGGQVISENDIAMVSHSNMYVDGGYVSGTQGIQNEEYCTWYSCWYNNIDVTGGHIVGTVNNGIYSRTTGTGQLTITGGVIEGQVNGVYAISRVRIGSNDDSVKTNTPVLIGHTDYGLLHSNYTEFYDGILKGIKDGHNGLVSIIPDGYLIKDDYEYIDRVEYQTDYLVEKGNWLKVGNKEFNSINKANQYITDENNTMTVIADAYVDFEQTISASKNVVFDFNGHSLIMTQPLRVNTNTRFVNSREVGGINNLRDNAVVINADTVIDGGVFHSDVTTTITNSRNLTINDGSIKADSDYALSSSGHVVVNGGEVKGERQANGVSCSGGIDVYGGTISSVNQTGLYINGNESTINGGTISSTKQTALSAYDGSLTINGGTIQSVESTAISSDNSYYGTQNTTVNNGNIIGNVNGIVSNQGRGTLTINNGHIVGETGTAVITSTKSYINGGNLEGEQYGLNARNSDTVTQIGNNDGTINIDSPIIKGDLYGLFISDSSTVNFYDGILKGITGRCSGIINSIADRSQIFEDEEVIGEDTYLTEYLVTQTDIVINVDTEVTYGNLQDAITQARNGETLKLLTNVPLYYEIRVTNNPNVTLDLDGHTISTNKPWNVSVPFTITNTSNVEASMKISTAVNLLTNTNTLTVNNITLKNTSSSNYVVNNSGLLTLDSVRIESLNGVQSSNELVINNSIINTTSNTISNTGKLTINGGTYTGGNYSLYSNSSKLVNISNATFNGTFYNSGNNTATMSGSLVTGNLQNYTSDLTINNSNVRTGRITNNGTLTLNGSTFSATTTQYDYYYYQDVACANTGTLNLNNSNVLINKENVGKSSIAISNTGTLNISNNSVVDIGIENSSYTYKAIYTSSSGLTNMTDSLVKANGGYTNYGLYIDGVNAKAVILTGNIQVENASTGYGVYIDKGTFEMGHYEGQGVTEEDVSTLNPLIFAQGNSRGIGVKKVNASFNFYDGKIRASKYAKPETTTNVEYQFEVTTYIENDTGYEYAILEYMRNDYQGDTVCLLNDVYYKSITEAIDKAGSGDEIILLKSIEEDFTVPTNRNIKLNLNQHSITTKVINNGTLNVYNGSLQNFDDTTIDNRGTLILGENDNNVSSSNIRIISEATTIQSTGTIIMYDGYIEGEQALDGKINTIAQYARIRTVHDEQSEKKFIQSLSPEAIMNGETDLIITVDPDSGYYEGTQDIREIFKKYHETYTLSTPTKRGCNFVGWEVSDDATFDSTTNTITVDISDVSVKAIWEVSNDAVARIGEEYYLSLQEALDSASDNDVVELLKDTTEDITNRSNVKLDLGGYTVTGAFINQGELRLVNGTIENTSGIGMINQKLLVMGDNDGNIREESVKIIGTSVGLQQDAIFKFYDGFIEGDIALNGKVDSVPQGYFIFNDRNNIKNCQRVYLIGNPANAVAVIENGGTQYFFSLQSAIDTATITGDEIFIIRDFEAAYAVNVSEDANIILNMNGHNITMGNAITNNGTLKIYDTEDEVGSITTAKYVTNNGNLTVENIKIKQTTSETTITNNGTLNLVNATIEATNGRAITNNGPFTMDENSLVTTNGGYSFYNNYDGLVLNAGEINSIYNYKSLILEDGIFINSKHSNAACVHSSEANSSVVMNGGTCKAVNIGFSLQGTGQSLTVNGGEIKSSSHAIYVSNGSGANSVTINDGVVESSSNHSVYLNGISHHLVVNDGLIKSKSGAGIWANSYTSYAPNYYKVEIKGGEIEGTDHASVFHYTDLDITGGEFNNKAKNRDRYAIYKYYGGCSIKNTSLVSNDGSGVYVAGTCTFSDMTVDVNALNSYGMVITDGTLNLNSGTVINTAGKSSIGVLMADNSTSTINYNGAEINSYNIGIDTTTNTSTKKINLKTGTIKGETYGINLTGSGSILNVGEKDVTLSTTDPLVTGGLYGVHKTNGTMNFYSGVVRGYNYGYSGEFSDIRRAMDITEESEDVTDNSGILTYAGENVSETATTRYAKSGNGYARITYIGEDNATCTNGYTWNFDFTGSEETFTANCGGQYRLETWGAQGGSYSTTYKGGYGGYSTGEITLQEGETLYINVGGQGEAGLGLKEGGYNGGGQSFGSTCNGYGERYGGSGGGATHIATASGLLASLENNKSSVIMVAGGGGGSHYYYAAYGSGASGGGYLGNDATWTNSGHYYYVQPTGGTQTSGGTGGYSYSGNSLNNASFGHGGDYNSTTCNEGSGGGAGWYGGGSGQFTPGAGGSGYIGNDRLSNAYMYGYNVQNSHNVWIKNYLVEKDKFLQVDDQKFNSINSAVEYIINNLNGVGTITLLKEATIQEDSEFSANTTITFDLNGHILQSTRTIVNNGDLTIVDSTNEKAGMLYNRTLDALVNHASVHVVNGKIQSDSGNAILGNTNEGTITVDSGVVLKGVNAINTTTKYTITVNDASLIGSTNAIYATGTASKINVTDTSINATSGDCINASGASSTVTVTNSSLTAGDDGVVVSGAESVFTLDGGEVTGNSAALNIANRSGTSTISNATITGKDYGVYINSYSMNLNFSNNTIKCNNAVGINDVYNSSNGRNTITITGGTIEGKTHGIHLYYSNLNTSDVEIKSTGSSNDYYGIYTDYTSTTVNLNQGTKITCSNASGIRNVATTNINDVILTASGNNCYGVVNTSSGTLNINGGTIYGKKYGVYQSSTSSVTNVGNSEALLSIENPVVQGDQYGVYIESGKGNFYGGRLKGNTDSYYGVFYRVRKGHSIYTFDEVIDESSPDVVRKVSYLTETDGFLQVGDDPTNIFNTFEDAIASITGTTDTITVLNDNMVYEEVVIPEGKDITLKLNNHKLTMTQTLVNYGTLSITGEGDLSDNLISNNTTEGITNKGILNLDNVTIETTSVGIRGNSGTNPITVNNSKVRARTAIQIDTAQPLTITDSVIEGTNGNAIGQSASNQKTTITDSRIISSDSGVRQSGSNTILEVYNSNIFGSGSGINQSGTDATVKVISSVIRGNTNGIYSEGYRDIITIKEGSRIEGNTYGLFQDRNLTEDYAIITVDDVTITGGSYGAYIRGAEFNTTNTSIVTSSTDRDKYSVVCEARSRCNFSNNTNITAQNASCIYANTFYDVNLTNTKVESGAVNGYGIYAYDGNININTGTEINMPGIQSYGVYESYYDAVTNVNGGDIYSKNIGIYVGCDRSDTKKVNVNKGTVIGEVYGISQTCSGSSVNIGNLSDTVSITDPYVEGGLISINKTNGFLNFYSGLLKGYVRGNPGTVDVVREGYEIFDDEDEAQVYIRSQKTISATDHSDVAIANTAKEGNGYAKITYEEYEDAGDVTDSEVEVVNQIGTPVDNNNSGSGSESGESGTALDVYNFDFTGDSQLFEVPESGLYSIETWGASGGYSLCNGGRCTEGALGGYTSGSIYLDAGTKLYIYVGGRGANGVVRVNSAGGYNGGGEGSSDGSDDETSGGGGGATDIRLVGGSWDNTSSLASRIMVAGGGGGASWSYNPGYAGGLSGASYFTDVSPAATQTNGYAFGIGQQGIGAGDSDGVAGGGAGYWGGRTSNTYYKTSGSGGSSYISGHTGSVAIISATSTSPRLDSRGDTCIDGTSDQLCSVHYSNYKFDNTTMIDGAGYTWSNEKGEYVGQTQPNGEVTAGHEGNGYARIKFLGSYDKKFEYTGSEETYVIPTSGYYMLETWGASGGNANEYRGGYGGYSVGKVYLNAGDTLYVNVGGAGIGGYSPQGGYNGGGAAGANNAGQRGSGGGATHIATTSGLLSTLSSSTDDILIVSGGGGGADDWPTGPQNGLGGDGGGYLGKNGTTQWHTVGGGGTQSSGGGGYASGTFGLGADAPPYAPGGAGGGGGYYGGGSSRDNAGAGGGSGYIGNDNLTDKHMTCYECSTSDGASTKTISNSDVSENPVSDYSKIGDGYAKVTYVGGNDIGSDTHTITLSSSVGTIANANLVYADGATLGNISQPVVSDDDLVFVGWFTNKDFTKQVDENTVVYMSTTLYAKFNYSATYCRTLENTLVSNFDFTDDEQSFQVLCPGKYKLEAWGAQGGSTKYNTYSNTGGYGGYTIGYATLKQNEKLYVYVGGAGNSVDYQQSSGTYTFDDNHGYNGGGEAILYTNNSCHAGGGGATHISTRKGLLSTLVNNKDKVLIVAGGGGGSSTHMNYPSYSGDGGSGGGAVAGSGTTSNTTCYNYGTGGTQTGTGTYVACQDNGNTNRNGAPNNPGFGLGSNYTSNSTSKEYAGGGAGWYGGQSGHHAPGGGGSSYVSSKRLYDSVMYGYGVDEAYTDNKSNIAYLIAKRELIVNQTTDEKYTNLQDAIDDSSNNDVLQYIGNDYISYDVEIPVGKHITIDLNGFNLIESKQIVNNGSVTITNSSNEYTSKITNNTSTTQIVNNGTLVVEDIKLESYNGIQNSSNATLVIQNADIETRNTGVSNAGRLTVDGSTIYGPTYDIYSNSEKTELLSNVTLKSSSYAYYKYSNGDTTITDSSIRGPISNARTGQPLEVKDSVITSYIRNTGTTTYTNNEIKVSIGNDNNSLIYNTGTLIFTRNDVEFKSNSTSYGNYENIMIDNRGTMTSTNNDYVLKYDYNSTGTYTNRYRYLYQVKNYGLFNSTDDEYTTLGSQYMYFIYNNSSNQSVIDNATVIETKGVYDSMGILNDAGTITINDSSIEIDEARYMYGVKVNAGTVNINNTNINIHDSINDNSATSYGAHISGGKLVYDAGTTNLTNVKNAYGAYINNSGNFEFKNGNLDLASNTNSYGVYLDNTNAIYTQGTYDGRGTDEANVSVISPRISAIGLNTGLGVRMGGGTFNFYDGYIIGSTSPRQTGDITSATELNYQVVTKQDEVTGYNYCILEYNK